MKKGTKIHDHLRQLDELADQLTAIGEDVHKVAVLLRSVQETLVTALLARGDGNLTLIFVKQSLLDEEQRRGKESTVNDGDSAFMTRSTRVASQAMCTVVIMLEIVQTKPHQYKHRLKKVEDRISEDSSDSTKGEVFVTTAGLKAEMKDEDWIIDSGASRHMT